MCYDSAYPDVQDSATVSITVQRNINAPIFTSSRYTQTISERHQPGTQVVCFNATDADGDYIYYDITGDVQNVNNDRISRLYFLDQATRCIYLKADLTAYSHREDNVSIIRATFTL